MSHIEYIEGNHDLLDEIAPLSSIIILVAYSNDRVMEFYRRFNFYPRSYILREPPKKNE